jgi:hypothetical protein
VPADVRGGPLTDLIQIDRPDDRAVTPTRPPRSAVSVSNARATRTAARSRCVTFGGGIAAGVSPAITAANRVFNAATCHTTCAADHLPPDERSAA